MLRQPDDPGADSASNEIRRLRKDLKTTTIVLGTGAVLFILYLLIVGV